MKKYICTVCGYVHEGDAPPETCPLCNAPKEKFKLQSGAPAGDWATEHQIGLAGGVDQRIIDGLRANFTAECTEVGMYLAMGRQADREGLPEVGEAYRRIAFEEAGHAARFAELLGEVLEGDTRANLDARIAAERGACKGKKELAALAGELGLDDIQDTIMEMGKDEARHGQIFEGLRKRLF